MAIVKRKKVKRIRLTSKHQIQAEIDSHYGEEPTWEGRQFDNAEDLKYAVLRALNWYNACSTDKMWRKYIVEYAKHINMKSDDVASLKTLELRAFNHTGAGLARMASLGASLPESDQSLVDTHIKALLQYAGIKQTEKDAKDNADIKSVVDYTNEKASIYIGMLERIIDEFVTADGKHEFDAYSWFTSNDIKPLFITKIRDHFEPLLVELKLAKSDKSSDEAEAYSFITPRKLTKFIELVDDIISSGKSAKANAKTAKKPRKRKSVPVNKAVAKVKYQTEFSELQIKSVDPAKIIGASILVTYNTKYHRATVFQALDRGGFKVKGSTVYNYDETLSVTKAVRDTKDNPRKLIVTHLRDGGKRLLHNLMTKELATKESKTTGRLGQDTILLQVIK